MRVEKPQMSASSTQFTVAVNRCSGPCSLPVVPARGHPGPSSGPASGPRDCRAGSPWSACFPAAEDRETSRFPNAVLLRVHGVSDRAGFHRASRWRHAGCGLPLLPTASAPRRFMNFAAQYPARTFPCQRFDGAVTHADA